MKYRLTRTYLYLLLLPAILLLHACGSSEAPKSRQLKDGRYEILFDAGEVKIPARLRIEGKTRWILCNWNEEIVLDSLSFTESGFRAKLPLFDTWLDGTITSDSTFQGKWTDHSRDSLYQISFSASPAHYAFASGNAEFSGEKGIQRYAATFSPGVAGDETRAVGEFFFGKNNHIVGTFLTESGDYRFLEGSSTGQSLYLSTFDGAHLFYFCANIDGEKLTDGKFHSGHHWQEEWIAQADPAASLRDPDSLTFVADTRREFGFTVLDQHGDSIHFGSDKFMDHVTVVQIFGSWCPNCTDESRFIQQLYSELEPRGLRVIPVAFERSSDFETSRENVLRQFSELDLQYPPYFGGRSGKENASRVFSQLSTITSYPTMIIVDRHGVVRKIHTGFYGPGTGSHYTEHTQELRGFILNLLGENLAELQVQ